MDLTKLNQEFPEARIADLVNIVQAHATTDWEMIDVGARHGHFSMMFVDLFKRIVAIDIAKPEIPDKSILAVQGDATKLPFPNGHFDFVFCAEVLEHIPPHMLRRACLEMSRVSKDYVLIGVPYKQDIRVGRTTCGNCGKTAPPWGHVNRFDEFHLEELFPDFEVFKTSYVGQTNARTNFVSTFLMDRAGNPFGVYEDLGCMHCGQRFTPPNQRTISQRLMTRAATVLTRMQRKFHKPHPNWIHVLLKKTGTDHLQQD